MRQEGKARGARGCGRYDCAKGLEAAIGDEPRDAFGRIVRDRILLAHDDGQCPALLNCADVVAETGVRHTVWRITDSPALDRLTSAFDAMPAVYIADGHHRSAAASRVAASRRAANRRHDGNESYNFFLTIALPHHQMRILPYNRVVTDLNGLSRQEFLSRLGQNFSLHAAPNAVMPAKPGEFGLYLPAQWYRLNIHPAVVPARDPVERLDVSLLASLVMAPVLGITDPRRDKRIDFIGGIRGLAELEQKVDNGSMAAALTTMAALWQPL